MIGKQLSINAPDEFDKMMQPAIIPRGLFSWDTKLVSLVSCAAVLSLAVGLSATPYMGLATLAFASLTIGLINRRQRVQHVFFMNFGIALDLAIVLILELQRNAIATAISFTLSPLQQAHIAASSVATALYIPILILGWKRYRGASGLGVRSWHLRLGIVAFVFRALGFILMFALIGRPTVVN